MVEAIGSVKLMSKYHSTVRGLLLAMLLSVTAMHGASEKETDAQRDGLLGPVKSVSKTEKRTQVKLDEPDGPSVLLWSGCAECEYDKDGNRTKTGEIANSEFRGQTTRYVRDADGAVIEQVQENEKGEPTTGFWLTSSAQPRK